MLPHPRLHKQVNTYIHNKTSWSARCWRSIVFITEVENNFVERKKNVGVWKTQFKFRLIYNRMAKFCTQSSLTKSEFVYQKFVKMMMEFMCVFPDFFFVFLFFGTFLSLLVIVSLFKNCKRVFLTPKEWHARDRNLKSGSCLCSMFD